MKAFTDFVVLLASTAVDGAVSHITTTAILLFF